MKPGLGCVVIGLSVAMSAPAVSVMPEELAEARQWSAAKFAGQPLQQPTEPALIVLANHDPVQKNARGGRPMRIVDKEYTRGLYCHAFSKIVVRLPGPGARFSAIVGVDSNEQTSGGRGSVEFSVSVGGTEKFRSGVMREGMAGRPVTVDLGGAAEFVIQVDETPDGISCDQSNWAEAKVTLQDGRELWLADLPLREAERAPYSTDLPFSFVYDGKASAELLKTWQFSRSRRGNEAVRSDPSPPPHVGGYELTWTDPHTGLQVRCVSIEYADFPNVEWTVYFKNTGARETPMLSDLRALDTSLTRGSGREFQIGRAHV